MQIEPKSAIDHQSSIAIAKEDESSIIVVAQDPPAIASAEGQPPVLQSLSEEGPVPHSLSEGGTLNRLINPQPSINHQLSTIDHQLTPTVIDAKPLPAAIQHRKTRRNGRVASLPKLQRDMVNRMIWNSVPYKNIVAALDEAGFNLTERNIPNWATGGWSMTIISPLSAN
jgi:hypothetical protein